MKKFTVLRKIEDGGMGSYLIWLILMFIFTSIASVTPMVKEYILYFVIAYFVLMEIVFWTDAAKPKKGKNKWWYTLGKKWNSFLLGGMLFAVAGVIIIGVFSIIMWVIDNKAVMVHDIQAFMAIVGWIVLGLAILFVFIYLNSLKYWKVKK